MRREIIWYDGDDHVADAQPVHLLLEAVAEAKTETVGLRLR